MFGVSASEAQAAQLALLGFIWRKTWQPTASSTQRDSATSSYITPPEVMQRALRAEIAQDVVCDAVGELMAVRAVGEQPAESADDQVDGLPARGGRRVDERDLAAETGRLERR
jgi:hypothetical protein